MPKKPVPAPEEPAPAPETSEPAPEELESTPKKPKRRRRRTAQKAAKEERTQGPWWLGAIVIYVCMLSAMLLAGLVASSIGFSSDNAGIQILVDNTIVWDNSSWGGWDWFNINVYVGEYTGRHTITIRWVTADGTLGSACFDNLYFIENAQENTVDDFETDPATDVNGWTYLERDTDNVMEIQRQNERVASGSYGWRFNASARTAAWDSAQITKSFDLTGVENIQLWTWTTWDLSAVGNVISQVASYSVVLIIAYLHVSRFERKKFWPSVGVKREGMLKSVIFAFALWVIFVGILLPVYWTGINALTGGNSQQYTQVFSNTAPDWFFVYLGFAFFIPVALTEELIFRGFMTDRFSVKGPVKAIALSSLLFATLHIRYLSAPLNYGALFLLAAWWGIVYLKTRNIFGLILAHGIYNFFFVA